MSEKRSGIGSGRRRSLVLLLALTMGCGYTLAGRGSFLPARIKVIGIPPFDASVPQGGVAEIITEEVTKAFVSRGGYRIVPTTAGADASLNGTITGFVVTPVAFDEGGRATRSLLTLTASVSMRDVVDGTVLYENPAFQFRTDLELGQDAADFFDPQSEAIGEIAREFARTLVATVVEGF